MKTNRFVPFVIGVISLIAAVLLILYVKSWLGSILAAIALGFAYNGIKDAVCLTDEEIKEATKF